VTIAERRDADLDRRDDPHRVVHQAQRRRGAPPAALGESRPPGGHDRVLGHDEEGVARDQRQDREETQRVTHGERSGGGVVASGNRRLGSASRWPTRGRHPGR